MSHKHASKVSGWYETEQKSEVTIRRAESGFLQTYKGLASRSWLNGRGYNDTVAAASVGHELTYHIGPHGNLVAVDGLRDRVSRLRARVPKQVASQLRNTEREMLGHIQEVWKRRVFDFVDRTVSLGEAIDSPFPFPLPGGAEVSMPQTILALRFVACPAGRCVVLLQDYESDDPRLVAYVREAVRGDPIVFVEGDRATPRGCRVTAKSSRVIDPDTMRIYEEDGTNSASLTLDLPGRGEILFERAEDWRRNFEYR